MNKNELIADLKNKDWVWSAFNAKTLEEINDIKLYEISFLEIGGDVAIKRSYQFYVIDENQDTETAFYKDREPEQIIRMGNALLKQYAAQIADIKGKVLESNDNYIIVEAYAAIEGAAKKVIYIADADEIRTLMEG